MSAREFDIVVYGATGFTGKLVAEYLLATYGVDGGVRWAIAGRFSSKLDAVRTELAAPAGLPTIIADAAHPATLEAMARRTRVVLTTVGPYQLYGEPLIAACVAAGTDYVDLCGEPAWMAAMIAKYEAQAKASGARIVFSCGFDSIPFEGGVFFLQQEAKRRFGAPCPRVRGRVRKIKGGASGGTIASGMATAEASARDPSLIRLLANPYALVPDPPQTRQPRSDAVVYDDDIPSWSAPFIMATINTKNVHRGNALMNYSYGRDFTYDEMQMTSDGAAGRNRAKAARSQIGLMMGLIGFAPTRALLRRFALPKPGQGPGKSAREAGMFELLFIGDFPDGRGLRAVVTGDRDPGYGATSKMIGEAALCMVQDISRERTPGGIWTALSAMGEALLARLEAKAGVKFSIEA